MEKSRIENQNKDIADIETSKVGIHAGWIVSVCLLALAAVLDGVFFGRPAYEALFAVMVGLAVVFFCKYARMKKLHELIAAICLTIGSCGFLIGRIMQIMKR
ncbi:MAG: hypothetical protein II920_10415 [Clostridia bacterium]|nr:hypothetical protein [Clostridia bacterium]